MNSSNRTDIINQEWLDKYTHFRQRLQERYHMDISFIEYVLLCRRPFVTIARQGDNRSRVWVKVRTTWVIAVREIKRARSLVTALPRHNEVLPENINALYEERMDHYAKSFNQNHAGKPTNLK